MKPSERIFELAQNRKLLYEFKMAPFGYIQAILKYLDEKQEEPHTHCFCQEVNDWRCTSHKRCCRCGHEQ